MSTRDELEKEINESYERMRQERMVRGLPENLPEAFVSIAMTTVLIERCKPIFQYVAKYTQLCSDSRQMIPVDISIFDRYSDYFSLLRFSKSRLNVFATGIQLTKKYMSEADDISSVGEYVRRLGTALNLAKLGYEVPLYQSTYNHREDKEENAKLLAKAAEEYEHLTTDEAFFNAEVERYLAHYESIKRLI